MNTPVRPRLRPWRRGFALKQKEVASLLGISSTTHVSRLERGERVPSLELAIAFEVLTGEPVCFLFPDAYDKFESRTVVRVRKFLKRIAAVETTSASRKKELLADILARASARNPNNQHVE